MKISYVEFLIMTVFDETTGLERRKSLQHRHRHLFRPLHDIVRISMCARAGLMKHAHQPAPQQPPAAQSGATQAAQLLCNILGYGTGTIFFVMHHPWAKQLSIQVSLAWVSFQIGSCSPSCVLFSAFWRSVLTYPPFIALLCNSRPRRL